MKCYTLTEQSFQDLSKSMEEDWYQRKCIKESGRRTSQTTLNGSDKSDPYRDGGRVCPVRGGVMDHMFNHCVLRHVLHKVCLWSVCPAAHTAAVGLGVFDGMGWQVYLKWGGVWVGTVAVCTLEGLVFVVLPLMWLQIRKLGESFFTSWMGTLVWPITRVDPGVLLQMRELPETLLTVGTAILPSLAVMVTQACSLPKMG